MSLTESKVINSSKILSGVPQSHLNDIPQTAHCIAWWTDSLVAAVQGYHHQLWGTGPKLPLPLADVESSQG